MALLMPIELFVLLKQFKRKKGMRHQSHSLLVSRFLLAQQVQAHRLVFAILLRVITEALEFQLNVATR